MHVSYLCVLYNSAHLSHIQFQREDFLTQKMSFHCNVSHRRFEQGTPFIAPRINLPANANRAIFTHGILTGLDPYTWREQISAIQKAASNIPSTNVTTTHPMPVMQNNVQSGTITSTQLNLETQIDTFEAPVLRSLTSTQIFLIEASALSLRINN